MDSVLVDFIGGVKTLLLGSSLQCIGLVLYYPTTEMSSLYIVSLIFGLSQGGIVPSYAIIVREYMPPQEAGARVMCKLGFRRGRYNPCLYFHREKNLRTFLHGDDFATVGIREGVRWFRGALEQRFEIKSQCIGHGGLSLPHSKVAGSGSGPAPSRSLARSTDHWCLLRLQTLN